MASENENVMDLLSEWRDCIESADPSVWNDERIAGLVKTTKAQQLEYLARIEAAWKREKAEIEADALAVGGIVEAARKREREPVTARHGFGNAAAMREALCAIVMLTMKVGYSIHGDVACGIIASKAKHALSSPARNCDLPLVVDGPATNNADKAWLVFKNRNPDAYFDVSGLLRCIDWLLAPAAERKGECDGM